MGLQFIGDSMMTRLASHATSLRPTYNKELNASQLGLCIGGQTCGQLLRRLKDKDCPVIHKKVVLMIGTNNILKRVPSEDTCRAIGGIVKELLSRTDKLIVLTIPPIPKVEDNRKAQEALSILNEEIKAIPNSEKMLVHNITHCFYEENTLKPGMFEDDLIHWNRAAMEAILLGIKEAELLV